MIIIDCLRVKYNLSPITYGDTSLNYLGNEIPRECLLTHDADLCSKNCLDYIL